MSMMTWWKEERLLTNKDKEAIAKARGMDWTEIDPDTAETDIGKSIIRGIISWKYHREEYSAGMG